MNHIIQEWSGYPINKHFWAFYYYCKRLGDDVHLAVNSKSGEVTGLVIVKDIDDMPAYCGECGGVLELVRPGKHQCNYCEEKEDV